MSPRSTLFDVRPEDRPVVERLWQLYRHNLSEYRGMLPGEDGLFGAGPLPSYFRDPGTRRTCWPASQVRSGSRSSAAWSKGVG